MRPVFSIVIGLLVLGACSSTASFSPPDPPAVGSGGATSGPTLGRGGMGSGPTTGSGGAELPKVGLGGAASGPSQTPSPPSSSGGSSSSSGGGSSGAGATKDCCVLETDTTCSGGSAVECVCQKVAASIDCASLKLPGSMVPSCAGFSSCCGTSGTAGTCVCANPAFVSCQGGQGATCATVAQSVGLTLVSSCP